MKKLFWLLSLLLAFTIIFAFVSAQENSTTTSVTQQNTIEKDSLIESQRNFDRSLNILNAVSTSMGTLVSVLNNVLTVAGIIIAIAVALGVLEIKRWQQLRKYAETHVEYIKKLRHDAETAVIASREPMSNIRAELLSAVMQIKPSTDITLELKGKLDEVDSKLKILEALGGSLEPADYVNRGVYFLRRKQFDVSLIDN